MINEKINNVIKHIEKLKDLKLKHAEKVTEALRSGISTKKEEIINLVKEL